jgi:hypothetical protein
MELAQNLVKWWSFVLAVSNLLALLPESQLLSKANRRKRGCEVGWWMELAQDNIQ